MVCTTAFAGVTVLIQRNAGPVVVPPRNRRSDTNAGREVLETPRPEQAKCSPVDRVVYPAMEGVTKTPSTHLLKTTRCLIPGANARHALAPVVLLDNPLAQPGVVRRIEQGLRQRVVATVVVFADAGKG